MADPVFSSMANSDCIYMEIVPYSTDQESLSTYQSDDLSSRSCLTNPKSRKRRSASIEDSDDYQTQTELHPGSNFPKRRRQHFELDIPVTDPLLGPPLHDPELYERIQRLGKTAGSYLDAGAVVVLRYEPFEPRGPTPSVKQFVELAKPVSKEDLGLDETESEEKSQGERKKEREESIPRPPISPLTPKSQRMQRSSDEESARRGVRVLPNEVKPMDNQEIMKAETQKESCQAVQQSGEITAGQTGGKRLPELMALQAEMEGQFSPSISPGQTGGKKLPELLAYQTEMGQSSTPPIAADQRRRRRLQGQSLAGEAGGHKRSSRPSKRTASQENAGNASNADSDFYTGREETPPRPPPSPRLSPTPGLKRVGRGSLLASFPRIANFRRIRTWAGRFTKGPDIRRLHTSVTLFPYPCLTRPGRRDLKLPPRPPLVTDRSSSSAATPQDTRAGFVENILPNRDTPLPSIEEEQGAPPLSQAPQLAGIPPVPRGPPRRRARTRRGPPRGRIIRDGAAPASETQQRQDTKEESRPLIKTPKPAGEVSQLSEVIAAGAARPVAPITPAAPAAAVSEDSAIRRDAPRRRAGTRHGQPPGRKVRQLNIAPTTETSATTAAAPQTATGRNRDQLQAEAIAQDPASILQPAEVTSATEDAERMTSAAKRIVAESKAPEVDQPGKLNLNQSRTQPTTMAAPKKGKGVSKAKAAVTTSASRPVTRSTRAAAAAGFPAETVLKREGNQPPAAQASGPPPQGESADTTVKKGRRESAAPKGKAKARARAPAAKTTAKKGQGATASVTVKTEEVEELDENEGKEVEAGKAAPVSKAAVSKAKKGAEGTSKAPRKSTAKGSGKTSRPKKGDKKK
ncbi:hypothetical protein PRK78_005966 [Emydomyces testavorans]|uniref:Uncharacterized protein n=1 Tax=Emydomyces testavorans TaxID=2070801 RepID=A0AAF0IN47_9EURO|nr:hypothetical protein PRK78_005966 [Emydomyces testavorans]